MSQPATTWAIRRAAEDRQRGVMPSEIKRREDGDTLWAAFRAHHPTTWTGRDVSEFERGWDARAVSGDSGQA